MKLSYRISSVWYKQEEEFRKLLFFLLKYRDCVDELCFFTEYCGHAYYPLDSFKGLCDVLKDKIQQIKDNGFNNVGINMLDTIGHGNEAWDFMPPLPYQPMVGHDGSISKSCFCPNTDEFRGYIREKYRLAATAKPDFIWVDDDIRMNSHGIEYGCFCPKCISIFNNKWRTSFSREMLVDKLNSKDGGEFREKWVNQNIESIEELLIIIEKAVHEIDERIDLGLMIVGLGWSTYSGCTFDRWMKALKATKVRPGGGFYDDRTPFRLVHKALEVGRCRAEIHEKTEDIQYELENYIYQKLAKSKHIVLLECTTSILNGMNGIAFNCLKDLEGTMQDYHGLMKAIMGIKPLWKAMDEFAGSFKNRGLLPAISSSFDARRKVEDGGWFRYREENNACAAYVLSEIGVPLTAVQDKACGIILTGNMPYGFTNAELKDMLSKGVLMDGRALRILWELGLGEYCGVKITGTYDNGILERFTDDCINGEYKGEKRDGRAPSVEDAGYILEPVGHQVRIISELISYAGDNLGATFTLFENKVGGRIAVHGYVPWKHIHSSAKRHQILEVLNWISRDTMPVKINECISVVPFLKASEDVKQFMLMLLNASFDITGVFDVEINIPVVCLYELQKNGEKMNINEWMIDNGQYKTVVRINNINPWDFLIITS